MTIHKLDLEEEEKKLLDLKRKAKEEVYAARESYLDAKAKYGGIRNTRSLSTRRGPFAGKQNSRPKKQIGSIERF